jgi:2-polyprenyl-3-methyl-5-hydroxy-6-metoxy-1,4-benzoquinol methylase
MSPPQPHCPACKGENLTADFEAAEPGFSILHCQRCGLRRTWPPVPDDKINYYYPESYYGRANVRFNRLFESMTRLFQKRRSRVLLRRTTCGPVLDVGCGRGYLLNYLAEAGYEAHGLELSDNAAWHARHRLGLEVQTCDFLASDYPKGHFHAVIFWHTLEHFPQPEEALARAAELLQPGGLLAVAVPNSESLQARWFGRHWFHLDIPRHYYHFGTQSLRRLLANHGFRIVKLDHFCFEQNPYGWLQSLYNRLGFDHNLLYDALKNPTARSRRLHLRPTQLLLTLLTLPPFLAFAFLMTLIEAFARRGGTIEVYAMKKTAP